MTENGHKHRCLQFGNFRLYPGERLLTAGQERVPLTPRVMDLLIVLVENGGAVVSKESLFDTVWADTTVEEGNLNLTISSLRKHLGSQSNGSGIIETVPKLGYRFIAPVSEIVDVNADDALPRRSSRLGIWLAG